ncbi:hypothetical protein CgunFtcFv8_027376 [Champsocephalus gunnari]|uniref:Uncharacterized protein n=1 Tax=Champsocephalus gunnari TaxID=52237 RepID=A0AAN8I2Y5_CHAGU|nr:hypothetical protein CgunFtcFv8_027376 [Champsocephalus gunnari]
MAAVWMLVCVLTVCLARDLSPNEVFLKKAFALFQSIESRLDQDAGEVLHEVDEQLWNGTMSDEGKVERDDERRAQSIESVLERDAGKVLHEVDEQLWNGTMSDDEKLNGTMSDEHKLNGTMSDEHKLNGTMSDEHKLNGTMSDEHKLNGTMSEEHKLNGTMSEETFVTAYNRMISSIFRALERLISEMLSW